MEEEETKNTMCATWKEIPCTLWQQMMKDSITNMTNSDLIADLWQIWHDRDKNNHQEGAFRIYMNPFELDHEGEDKFHRSY